MSNSMKAIVLAAGKGTRLSPLTNTTTKHLLPVANKSIIYYALEQITEIGITDIGIIISPDSGSMIKEKLGDGKRWKAELTYIVQDTPGGLAHAVKSAQDFLGNSPFLMFLGDDLIQDKLHDFINEFNDTGSDGLVLLKEVLDPRAFGTAELDNNSNIINVVEKPQEPTSNLALVGIYFFSPRIHSAIAQIIPSTRGELEITDAIQQLVMMGGKVKGQLIQGWWIDTASKDDLLKANSNALRDLLKPEIKGDIDLLSRIDGKVEIKQGTSVENSNIIGPVSIAENCIIKDSSIGNSTSIAANSKIEDSHLENSIIMGNCRIKGVWNLANSVIGNNTIIEL